MNSDSVSNVFRFKFRRNLAVNACVSHGNTWNKTSVKTLVLCLPEHLQRVTSGESAAPRHLHQHRLFITHKTQFLPTRENRAASSAIFMPLMTNTCVPPFPCHPPWSPTAPGVVTSCYCCLKEEGLLGPACVSVWLSCHTLSARKHRRSSSLLPDTS